MSAVLSVPAVAQAVAHTGAHVVRSPVTDPSDVGPGWVAFVIVLALCVATTLLWLNMRKQLGKIRFEEKETPRRRGGARGGPRGGEPPAS